MRLLGQLTKREIDYFDSREPSMDLLENRAGRRVLQSLTDSYYCDC
jgi:hypothetical protein